jgi:hypothetical protein
MTVATRPARVARMLLRSAGICLVSVMSACVLPIAPEFQDPPASQNFAPEILDTDPVAGSIVSVTGTVPTFHVLVTDPNVGDDLQVRWIADYPPFVNGKTSVIVTTPVPSSGTVQIHDVTHQPNCVIDHLAPTSTHQFFVVVADRMFLDPGTPVDVERLPKDGLKNSRSWILNLDCSVPP